MKTDPKTAAAGRDFGAVTSKAVSHAEFPGRFKEADPPLY
jgi:hypothetical protein